MTKANIEVASKVSIDFNQITKGISALYQYVSKVESKDLTSMWESQKINLQFSYKKIPPTSNLIIKIPLPAAPVLESPEVCLFVKDIDKKNRDHEPTLHHYEDLLRKCNITCISEIIPLKKLRNEYKPFEAKRALSNQFDIFLCDSRIKHLIPSYLGKNFYGRKRIPISVNMSSKQLKMELDKGICLTQCCITNRGSSSMVAVGHTKMTQDQAAKNVMAAVLKIAENIPGGPENIKNIHLKTEESPSLPIYLSIGGAEDVKLPRLHKKIPLDEPEEVSTVEGAKIRVTRLGQVHVIKDNIRKQNRHKKGKKQKSKQLNIEVKNEETKDRNENVTSVNEECLNLKKMKQPKCEESVSPIKKAKKRNIKDTFETDVKKEVGDTIGHIGNVIEKTSKEESTAIKSSPKSKKKQVKRLKTPQVVNKEEKELHHSKKRKVFE